MNKKIDEAKNEAADLLLALVERRIPDAARKGECGRFVTLVTWIAKQK